MILRPAARRHAPHVRQPNSFEVSHPAPRLEGMRIRGNRFSLILALTACALALVPGPGCDRMRAGERTVVRMWAFPMLPELRDFELYQELIAEFRKEHPEIDVQVEMLPWTGRQQKMLTAIAGDRAPDAVYLNLDLVPRFVDLDLLHAVDDYVTDDARADYDPAVVEGVTISGRMWMFPMLRTVAAGLYNKDLFAQAGLDPEKPPRTWEELQHVAKTLTRDTDGDGDIDQWGLGYVFGGDTLNYTFWPLLWQAGGDVLTTDGTRTAFDGPEGLEALHFIVGLFREGTIPRSFLGTGGNDFTSGRVAYWLGTGQLEATTIRRDAPNIRLGVAPVLEHKRRLGYSTIGGFAIFKASRHADAAAKWLTFLTRPDNMKKFCRTTNFLPTRRSVGLIYQDDPILGALEREAEFCRADVKSVIARDIMRILAMDIQKAAIGEKSPEQALKDAAAAVNAILKKRER